MCPTTLSDGSIHSRDTWGHQRPLSESLLESVHSPGDLRSRRVEAGQSLVTISTSKDSRISLQELLKSLERGSHVCCAWKPTLALLTAWWGKLRRRGSEVFHTNPDNDLSHDPVKDIGSLRSKYEKLMSASHIRLSFCERTFSDPLQLLSLPVVDSLHDSTDHYAHLHFGHQDPVDGVHNSDGRVFHLCSVMTYAFEQKSLNWANSC